MAETFYLQALDECRREAEAAVSSLGSRTRAKVTFGDGVAERFLRRFAESFKEALGTDERRAPAAWDKVRDQLLMKVHAIAALAISFALWEHRSEISEEDLRKATESVRPDCDITTEPVQHRLIFCGDF